MDDVQEFWDHITKDENWTVLGPYHGFTVGLKKEERLGFDQILRTEREVEHLEQRLAQRKISRRR
jgi:hypothetical protein